MQINNMLKIFNCEQKSEEWFKLHDEYPLTASKASEIGNQGAGLNTLCWDKMAQKYSIADKKTFSTEDTERGVEFEPHAREMYELKTGNKVVEVGFIINEEYKLAGVSPDGLVGEDGLVEIKCFADTKHFEMICDLKENGEFEIEKKYLWQMQMQMLITGRKWNDFVAYNPNYKERLLIRRILPDEEFIEKLKQGLKKGEELINKIQTIYDKS
jgi:putative phage-type endonuclease